MSGPLLRGRVSGMSRVGTAKPIAAPPPGPEMSEINVKFFDSIEEAEAAKIAAAAKPTQPPPTQVPTDTAEVGLKVWDPFSELRVPISEPRDQALPTDGIMWDVAADGTFKRHVPDDERPNAPFGRAYFRELLRARLEQEQNAVYQFISLLDGNLQGRSRSAQALGSMWLANNPGGSAISMIFQNLLGDVTAGVAGRPMSSTIDADKILPAVKQNLLEGLEATAGKRATDALGIDTEAGRVAAAQSVDGSRNKALDFAERAVKISVAAKDLPDPLVGGLVRDVVGLGNAALASPSVAAGVTIVPLDTPAPAVGAPSPSVPKLPVAPAVLAVPKGVGASLEGKNRSQVALELAAKQIVNADYQLYMIMNDNPTEAKLKAWDLLYHDGRKYVRPRSVPAFAKELEAVKTITKLLNDASGASSSRDSNANALIAHYQSAENTGFLFIENTARAAIMRAYDQIRYAHGNQSVPLIAFMTQEAVQSRFAEYVAWVYHSPPGAAVPRGGAVSGALRYDENMYQLGKWLASCSYRNGRLVPPGYNPLDVAVRHAREHQIEQSVAMNGYYPTGNERLDRAKRIRTQGEAADRRAEDERRARVMAFLSGGSV